MRRIDRKLNRKLSSTFGKVDVRSIHEVAFDDVAEIMKYARRSSGGDRWAGASFEHVQEWTQRGAPDLVRRLNEMLSEIELPEDYTRPETQRRRRRIKGDFGNELDIHACYQGRADRAWDRLHVEAVPTQGNRLVHVLVDLGAAAVVTAYDGLWRAAAALRIYDALVRLGKSVAISVYDSGAGMTTDRLPDNINGAMLTSVRVKDYGQPMREEMLAAVCVVPFLRHVMFSAPFRATGITPTHNLGFPISDYELRTDAAEQDLQHGGSVTVVGQAFSYEMAQQTVTNFLETYVRPDSKVRGYTAEEQVHNWR